MIANSDKPSAHLHYFFTCYLPQHRELSPHTLASYKQTFIHLMHYWNGLFPECADPAIEQFEVRFLLDFLSHLEKDLKNTASSRNARLAALKFFFKMMSLFEPRYQNQCLQILMIPAKRVRRWPFDYLEKREVDAVFSSVDTKTQDGYRDLCILRTLYNTGASASEFCGICRDDLDLRRKQVLLHGKGRKDRTLPLWDSTATFLATYLKSERRNPLPDYRELLFINQSRTSLTRSGLYSLCKNYLVPKLPASNVKGFTPCTFGDTPLRAICLWPALMLPSFRTGWGMFRLIQLVGTKESRSRPSGKHCKSFICSKKAARNQSRKKSTGTFIQVFWRFWNRRSSILRLLEKPGELPPTKTKNVLSFFARIA